MLNFSRFLPVLLVFLVHLLFYSNTLAKPDLTFERYPTIRGLSHNTVNAFAEDANGYIWVATQDGLNRFDGANFQQFKKQTVDSLGLRDNYLNALYPDGKAGLWTASNNGFLSYLSFKTQYFQHWAISEAVLTHLNKTASGTLLVGSDNGLYHYHLGEKAPELFEGTAGISIVNTVEHKTQQLLVATDQGLFQLHLSSGKWRNLIEMEEGINALVFDQVNQRCILATNSGIFEYQVGTKSLQPLLFTSAETMVEISSLELRGEDLWIGAYNGLFVANLESQTAALYQNSMMPNSLGDNEVMALFEDHLGVMWIGTRYSGVNKWAAGKAFASIRKTKSGLQDNIPRGYVEDLSGNLWFGYVGKNTVSKYNFSNRTFEHFENMPGTIYTILPEGNGKFWLGSWGDGLLYYDMPRQKILGHWNSKNSNLPHDEVQDILKDEKGRLWIASSGGLAVFDPVKKDFVLYQQQEAGNGLVSNYVQNGTVLFSDNVIWVGTWGGLSKGYLNDEGLVDHFENFQNVEGDASSLPDSRIISMLEKENGHLVLGTFGGGLFEIDPEGKVLWRLTKQDGLPSEVILGIHQDLEGRLWMSTTNGLVRYQEEMQELVVYGEKDGLQGNEFFWGGHYQMQDGRMIFSGTNGMSFFDPQEIKENPVAANVILENIYLMGKALRVGEQFPNGKQVLPVVPAFLEKIKLNHRQNILKLQFTALHSMSPENNRIRYRLVGFEEEWKETLGARKEAIYTNLEAGKYEFQMQAANPDGVWGATKTLEIKVVPPFYSTIWFIALVVLLISALVVWGIRYQIYNERRQQQKLQEKVNEAVAEVEEQKQLLEEKHQAEAVQRWMNEGLAVFSDVLNKNRDEVASLCQAVLSKLAVYLESHLGMIYLFDEDLGVLKPYASYGVAQKDFTVEVGEGLIGTVFKDGVKKQLERLPENYYQSINSGLGASTSCGLLLVPLKYEEIVVGVIELGYFGEMKADYVLFAERLAEMMTLRINAAQMAEKTADLLETSQQQSMELQQREEELRQNLEELQATQEESSRHIKALEEKLSASQQV
ncbi:ligand-binding sensor domain-containing protein [Persicobacter diffluens]|uniref:GAF domain-containing protein n=1 Tax=Persicobacter diffluens TaxID=981 RepID=A0AAN4VVW5_9BACT|nr:hypothetical protein PEDI_09190 [Persicobacter diffluens]